MTSTPLPASVTDNRINLTGLAAMLAATWAVVLLPDLDAVVAVSALMVAAALPIVAGDLWFGRVWQRPSTGLDWSQPRPRSVPRIATKLVGVAAIVAVIFAVYGLAPEYQGSFYDDYYRFLWIWVPIALVAGTAFVVGLDGYLVDPRDDYWHLGAAIVGPRRAVRWPRVADLARSWVIKAFFVPLMFVYATHNLNALDSALRSNREGFLYAYHVLFELGFLVDVVFTTMGYLLTLKVLDTHVRSAEPTPGGWIVALACYQPFFRTISDQYLRYNNNFYWDDWLIGSPILLAAWGSAILALMVVYAWATVTFGCRFSNLTHRGVLTNGPYRWLRHPAYVSKCLSWWLIYVPFLRGTTLYDAFRDCTWLSVLCLIYWLRARTEERHLSHDPAYVRYATQMNDRSLLAPLGRWVPFLAYRPPPSDRLPSS